MSYKFDSELADIAAAIPAGSFEDPVAAREASSAAIAAFMGEPDTTGMTIEDRKIPGPADAPDVTVRIYAPDKLDALTGGLLYIHGGGFAVGDLDSEHAGVVSQCRSLNIPIVSVGYRKAPEDPYPAGLEDCYAALEWFHANAAELKVDTARIGIRGGSAGGGLSAGLALLARDRGGPSICFQFLGIPELDDRLETVSMQTFTDTPMWHRPNAIFSWQYYLQNEFSPGADNTPIYAAPARATVEQLRGLPPAYVSTMEFDPLRDEGIEYALKLLQAGVNVELHNFPGTFHGSEMMMHAKISQRGQAEGLEALRRGLGLETS
jgi:acetyl esterase